MLLGKVADFLEKLTVSFYSVVEKEIAYGTTGCIMQGKWKNESSLPPYYCFDYHECLQKRR